MSTMRNMPIADLRTITTVEAAQAIEEMKAEQGSRFQIDHLNLAELERRTGISRSRLRRLKKNGFRVQPHGHSGQKAETTVLSGYTGLLDELLKIER